MTGYIFALLAAVVLPIAAMIYSSRRIKTWQPVLLGAMTFIVFQVVLRIPLLQVILPRSTDYTLFQFTQPVLFMIFLSFSAGLFEEGGRYLMMRRFMKGAPVSHGIAFGIGHGGIEAILLVGINLIAAAVTNAVGIGPATSGLFAAGGFERISAMVFHVCLSVMIWLSLTQQRPALLPLAILLHTLFNVLAGYLSILGVSVFRIEAALAFVVILLLIYTILTIRQNQPFDSSKD